MRVGTAIILVVLSMLLSFVSKRGIQTARSNAVNGRRMFSWRGMGGNGTGTGAGAGAGTGSGSGAGKLNRPSESLASLSTAASTSPNFEDLTILPGFTVAVAYQPKDRQESNLFKKKHSKPSPALLSPTGEDNAFVAVKDASIAVGVADGVGGWSEAGYDSSAISRELCATLKSNFTSGAPESPKAMLQDSFDKIMSSPAVEIGGTTACLGILTGTKLKVANLGDSWCGVFRDYKLVHETEFQTHNFNTPFQLAKIPRHIVRQAESEGRRYIIDTPEKADEYTWDLQKDDIVMFATDGVTDNVVPKDIEIFLKDHIEENKSDLASVAKTFVREVVKVSKDTNFPSSFAQELSRLTGQKYLGGKEDDITIVLVKVE